MDIFSNLRWKAANALTESLSKEERTILLKKLDAVDETAAHYKNDKDIFDIKSTIGEAIAAARVEESQKLQARWEKEKDDLMAAAEVAARARIESDILIQERRLKLERWKKEVEAEKRTEEGQLLPSRDSTVSKSVAEHALLGDPIADLGYKRIHLASAKTLSTIPVWKEQRIYRHDRAKAMAKDKTKTPHLGMPGIIVLHEDSEGKLSILDGQHRVGCMALLNIQEKEGFDLNRILVEVYSSEVTDHAEEIFTEINKAEPIKLVDMPGVASKGDRKIITDAAANLQAQYSEMFKPSQSCRPPHLNIDNFRDALFAAEVIKKHNLKSSKALTDWIAARNEELRIKFQDEEVARTVPLKALEKAKQFEFYLGMGDSLWLYS